jgi:glycosyltransferase involved in cell wall biosynthesis
MTNILDISICVACHPPYLDKLEYLLKSINNSDYYPKECIIGLSETPILRSREIENELKKKFNFLIVITNSNKKCNQAENRNRAISEATSKYITICDSDDIVHTNRLKIVYDIMEKEKCISLIHSFCKPNGTKRENLINNWNLNLNKPLIDGKILHTLMKKSENKHIHLPILCHHAYITFKKELFNNIKQDTRPVMYRKEDSKFVRDILKHYGNNPKTMIWYDIPLVMYY